MAERDPNRSHGLQLQEQAPPKPLKPISWWMVGATICAVVVVAFVLLWWLVGLAYSDRDLPNSAVSPDPTVVIDAVRTSLGASAGVAAAAALLLAFRRQRHAEHVSREIQYESIADRNQREDEARTAAHDAEERRLNEFFLASAEHLGATKAPVRLAGLYALESLAQKNPGQRQTVFAVWCSYLRINPKLERHPGRTRSVSRRGRLGLKTPTMHMDPEEREVRLAAQRLIASHLRPGPETGHPVQAFWTEIETIDLSDAYLRDLDFSTCRLPMARFDRATFVGSTWFVNSHFATTARFDNAVFESRAWFDGAHFDKGDGSLPKATFTGHVTGVPIIVEAVGTDPVTTDPTR